MILSFVRQRPARCGAVLAALMGAALCANAAEYYVSVDGNDANEGSFQSPFKTVQKGMNTVQPGDTLFLRGGIYREQVEVTGTGGAAGNPIRVFAYPGEQPVIAASELVRDWARHRERHKAIWILENWPVNSQQVFQDGQPLQQIGMPSSLFSLNEYPNPVGNGLESMAPGTFYYDQASQTLYAWFFGNANPRRVGVEVSVRDRTFFIHPPRGFFHVRGLVFRHSNNAAVVPQGASVFVSSDSVIEDCTVEWADFAGLHLGERSRALNCTVANSGAVGIGANMAGGILVSGCLVASNNYRNFNPSWHAGGLKMIPHVDGVVEKCEIAFNHGSGVWFDTCRTGNSITVRNNYIHNNNNDGSGVFLERTRNAQVINNIIAGSHTRGVYVSSSDDCKVYNNTLAGTASYSAVEMNGVRQAGETLTNNRLFNNIVVNDHHEGYELVMRQENGATIQGNQSDNNNFFQTARSIRFSREGVFFDNLNAWQQATGWDQSSLNANPQFLVGAGDNYETIPGSPVVDAGTPLAEVLDDYRGAGRPQGRAYDIGAYETAQAGGVLPVFHSIVRLADTFRLTFTLVPNRTNLLQGTSDFVEWVHLQEYANTNGVAQLDDTNPNGQLRFYRIVIPE